MGPRFSQYRRRLQLRMKREQAFPAKTGRLFFGPALIWLLMSVCPTGVTLGQRFSPRWTQGSAIATANPDVHKLIEPLRIGGTSVHDQACQ